MSSDDANPLQFLKMYNPEFYEYHLENMGEIIQYVFLSGRTFESMEPTEDILIAIYTIIGVVGLISNLVLILIILKSRSLRFFPYNVLLLNLMVSNILMTIFCIPFTLVGLIRRSWSFGKFLCGFIPAVQVRKHIFDCIN